jgi:hypothetical protein
MEKYQIQQLIDESFNNYPIEKFIFDDNAKEAQFTYKKKKYLVQFQESKDSIQVDTVFECSKSKFLNNESSELIKTCIEKQIELDNFKKIMKGGLINLDRVNLTIKGDDLREFMNDLFPNLKNYHDIQDTGRNIRLEFEWDHQKIKFTIWPDNDLVEDNGNSIALLLVKKQIEFINFKKLITNKITEE